MIKWKYKPSGYCPVQAEGWFLNYYFYFRARGVTGRIDFSRSEVEWENDIIIKQYNLYNTNEMYKAGHLNHNFCKLLIYIGCFKFLLSLLYDKAKKSL